MAIVAQQYHWFVVAIEGQLVSLTASVQYCQPLWPMR